MTRKNWLLVVLMSILVTGCGAASATVTPTVTPAMTPTETATIVLDEARMVGALGYVDTLEHEVLTWEVFGEIETIEVEVGEFVSEGDVLAQLNEDSLYGNDAETNEDTDVAEVTYQDLMQAYVDVLDERDAFYAAYDEGAIAEQELAIANQKKVVFEAEYAYERDLNLPTQAQIDQASARLRIAEEELAAVQADYDAFLRSRTLPQYGTDEGYRKWLVRKWRWDVDLANAQQAYNDDYYAYLDVVDGVSEEVLAVEKADVAYENEVLLRLEEELADLLAGPSEEEVLAMEQAVQEAADALDVATIVAPFDGRVTELYGEAAETVSRGTKLLRLDAWDALVVEADLLEVDLDLVEVGDEVDVYFDSKGSEVFAGEVIAMNEVGVSSWDITRFPVTVLITSEVEGIYPGMTAVIDIYVD